MDINIIGNINSSILVIGCFHGDEPQGKYLIEEYIKVNPDTNLCFVPCLNKYGYEHNWQFPEEQAKSHSKEAINK